MFLVGIVGHRSHKYASSQVLSRDADVRQFSGAAVFVHDACVLFSRKDLFIFHKETFEIGLLKFNSAAALPFKNVCVEKVNSSKGAAHGSKIFIV